MKKLFKHPAVTTSQTALDVAIAQEIELEEERLTETTS
jgi:hypothetical protein